MRRLNSTDRGAEGYSAWGRGESDTLKRLSTHARPREGEEATYRKSNLAASETVTFSDCDRIFPLELKNTCFLAVFAFLFNVHKTHFLRYTRKEGSQPSPWALHLHTVPLRLGAVMGLQVKLQLLYHSLTRAVETTRYTEHGSGQRPFLSLEAASLGKLVTFPASSIKW